MVFLRVAANGQREDGEPGQEEEMAAEPNGEFRRFEGKQSQRTEEE